MSDRPRRPEPELPPPPERPDCCFGGCAQCVLDDHAEAMSRWQEQCDEILRRHQARAQSADDDDFRA